MRKGLGEKFGVVFSFALVVTDTELNVQIKINGKERRIAACWSESVLLKSLTNQFRFTSPPKRKRQRQEDSSPLSFIAPQAPHHSLSSFLL